MLIHYKHLGKSNILASSKIIAILYKIIKFYAVKPVRSNILFIIPYHKIGGAENVHLEIIKSLPHKPLVFFPNINIISSDNPFKKFAYCFCHKRFYLYILISYFTAISFFRKSFIFGSNTLTFYKVLPFLRGNIIKIDLTHAFSSPNFGMEYYSLNYIDYLDKRIVINNVTFDDYENLYKTQNIHSHFLEKFEIIPNGVEIKDFQSDLIRSRFKKFIIGFVGRNSIEKRPHLFFEIAKDSGLPSKVIGDDFRNYKHQNPDTIFFENCNDRDLIRNEFAEISLLVVTSDQEGFPLVIMEAMELGIPIISTDVGSIKEHIKNNVNGFLIPIDFNISSVSEMIRGISERFEFYNQLSLLSRNHAVNFFDITNFRKRYQKLFE